MQPAQYDIAIFQGDSYEISNITLPDLSPFGGPSTLAGATISAQIRKRESSDEVMATFTAEILSAPDRQIRLFLAPVATAALSTNGVWDLQISSGGWVGTPLKGTVTLEKEVTR